MKWTHKITYTKTGEWWFGVIESGKLYHSGLHEPGAIPNHAVVSSFKVYSSIEQFYPGPAYEVKRLNTFKGNL